MGYCRYFFFDVAAATESFQRSVRLLTNSTDLVDLSLAYTGVGMCKYHLLELEEAHEAFRASFKLAQRIGDDAKASMCAANLCSVEVLKGKYQQAVQYGLQSLALGSRALDQPYRLMSYTNLIDAHLLAGEVDQAAECLERAKEWVAVERRWKARLVFLGEHASFALMTGNIGMALDLALQAEREACGRERAVPQPGLFQKLRVFRAAHHLGRDAAFSVAAEASDAFRNRSPLLYFDALAATAWLQRRFLGRQSPALERELENLASRAPGKRAALAGQGFLA